jgi:hypothetical protein
VKGNRQNRARGVALVPPPAAAVVIVASMVCLGYISIGARCEKLGREIEQREMELAAKRKEYRSEQSKWLRMKAPQNVERVLREFNLEMDWPRGDQVLKLDAAPGAVRESWARRDAGATGPLSMASLRRGPNAHD